MGCNVSTQHSGALDVSRHTVTFSERERRTNEARKKARLRQNLTSDYFGRDINDVYDLKDGLELGEGAFATVVQATHKVTGQKYAIKVFKLREGLSKSTVAQLRREVAIMKQLDHPNVVRLQEVFQEERRLYLVMDLATGGDLHGAFAANRDMFKDEAIAATVIRKVLLGVRYCHNVGICHGDIKLENILLESSAPDAEIKLTDFGLSVFAEGAEASDLAGVCAGTPDYLSPERIKGKLPAGMSHAPADLWAVGVLTYLLLSGFFPFFAPSDEGVKMKIRWSTFRFSPQEFGHVSADAKDFISRLLVKDPQKRMTAAEALNHIWMGRAKSVVGPVSAEVIGRFRKFGQRTNLQKLALEIIAHNLEPSQLAELEKEFLKMDTDCGGLISRQEFAAAMATQGVGAEESKELFDAMDICGSNQLAFNDFLAGAIGQAHVTERTIKAAFDRLDCDHTGQVTANGLQLIVGSDMTAEELAKAVAEIDTEGRGQISYKQFRSVMRRSLSMTLLDPQMADAALSLRHVGSKSSLATLSVKSSKDGNGRHHPMDNDSRRGRSRWMGSGTSSRRGSKDPLGDDSSRRGEPMGDNSVRSAYENGSGGSNGQRSPPVMMDASGHSGSGRSEGGFPALRRKLSDASAAGKLSKTSMRNLAALAFMSEPEGAAEAAQLDHRNSQTSVWSLEDYNVGLTLDESLRSGVPAVTRRPLPEALPEVTEAEAALRKRSSSAATLWPAATAAA